MPAIRKVNSYSLFPTISPLPPNKTVNSSLFRVKSASVREHADRTSDERHITTTNLEDTNCLELVPKPLKHSASMDRHVSLKPQLKLDTRRKTISGSIPDSPTLSSPPAPTRSSLSKSPKRSRPGPVTDLIILPYTDAEWRHVMEEVRKLFAKGQYKHCSMRCKQILGHAKDPMYQPHPLHTIYFSFYCAISLEQTARSLHNFSSQKLPLLHEALTFYQQASSQISYASFSADPKILSCTQSRHDSTSSLLTPASIRSSVDSIFSQSSACSSRSSSISNSPSENDTPIHSHRRNSSLSSILSTSSTGTVTGSSERRKKKVSFRDLYPLDEQTIIAAFPSPPSQSSSSSPTSPSTSNETQTQQHLARYRQHLDSLTTQLSYHTSSIHILISDLSSSRKTRRSNGPDVFRDLEKQGNAIVDAEEAKRRDLEERIRRGKENGWMRERWDPKPYRALCEKVEEEIDLAVLLEMF